MIVWEGILIAAALVGNFALWVAIFNNLHARKMPCWANRTTSVICYAGIALIPVAYAVWIAKGNGPLSASLANHGFAFSTAYLFACWAVAIVTLVLFLSRFLPEERQVVLANHTTKHDMLKRIGPRYDGAPFVTSLARLPGNQILELWVHDIELQVPRLPAALDGLTIAHISDLHYTGAIGKTFFEEVVEETLAMKADLILITGDIVDKSRCFDWIPDTLGRLTAPEGVFYILGNHDARVDVEELHRRLANHGLTYLGGKWVVRSIRDEQIVLAGNELPWFVPAADLSEAPARDHSSQPLRILLSHSPDQFHWARGQDVDLVLCGHTHGGQFRFPLVGPIVAPCRDGTRYAAGTFYKSPTVMHVSRGLSGTTPVRIGCPPELTKITLRSKTGQV